MKISVTVLIASLACQIIAMDNQPNKITHLSTKVRGHITTLVGIVARSTTGQLECKVTYHATNNTYLGLLINNGYEPAEWRSQDLDAKEAKNYYQQLLKTAADIQKTRPKETKN